METSLAFIFSFDSLVASIALGLSGCDRARRWKLMIAFGICDGLASAVGSAIVRPNVIMLRALSNKFEAILGVYVLAVFLLNLFCRKSIRPIVSWTVPIALSLDNLVLLSGDSLTVMNLVLVVLTSAGMSLVGFSLADFFSLIVRSAKFQRTFLKKATS
jgi:hypothetical protein